MASTPIQNLKRTMSKQEIKRLKGKGATVNAANTIVTVSAVTAKTVLGKYRTKLLDVGRGQRA